MPRKIVSAPIEPIGSIEEKWVARHGETFKSYTAAGEQLGITGRRVQDLVRDGYLQTTPLKRVLVRSAAAWANSNPRTSRRN